MGAFAFQPGSLYGQPRPTVLQHLWWTAASHDPKQAGKLLEAVCHIILTMSPIRLPLSAPCLYAWPLYQTPITIRRVPIYFRHVVSKCDAQRAAARQQIVRVSDPSEESASHVFALSDSHSTPPCATTSSLYLTTSEVAVCHYILAIGPARVPLSALCPYDSARLPAISAPP